MMLLLAFRALALVCCIATCSAGCFSPSSTHSSEKDFKELNKFLDKYDSTDPESIMKYIDLRWNKLNKGAKRAATIVKKMKDTEQCNDDTLELARQAVHGLTFISNKMDILTRYYGHKALEGCYSLFATKFKILSKTLDKAKLGPNWSSFVYPQLDPDHPEDKYSNCARIYQRFIPFSGFVAYTGWTETGRIFSTWVPIMFHLKYQLAQGDSRNNYDDVEFGQTESPNLHYTFEKYFVNPCKYYNSVMGDFFESIDAVILFKPFERLEDILCFPEDLQKAIYRYQMCRFVLNAKIDIDDLRRKSKIC